MARQNRRLPARIHRAAAAVCSPRQEAEAAAAAERTLRLEVVEAVAGEQTHRLEVMEAEAADSLHQRVGAGANPTSITSSCRLRGS
ncbi:MAG: hypothetical protein NVS9B11_03690 [Candidatus Dormibacteraceae bacterium]